MQQTTVKRAVILMNLGSPDSTRVRDVRKYLNSFLMDESVIDKPYLLRAILVRGIIVPFRSPKTAHAYSTIWGEEGSPLVALTKQLRDALCSQIAEPVEVAMRYGNPTMKLAYDNIRSKHPDIEEVVLLPLYPHYAMLSYETAVLHAEKVHKKGKYPFKITAIKPFYDDPYYLNAMCENIKPFLQNEYDHILFSYHGLPERHIRKSDITGKHCLMSADCCEVYSPAHKTCYRHQAFVTTNKIAAELNIPKDKFSISFQSRLGRDEWLKPDTAVRFIEMPKQGIKRLLVLCPAFVSDCLETLEEINIRGRESFMQWGGESYTYIPCLNLHPLWVKAIATWIEQSRDSKQKTLLASV